MVSNQINGEADPGLEPILFDPETNVLTTKLRVRLLSSSSSSLSLSHGLPFILLPTISFIDACNVINIVVTFALYHLHSYQMK
jgi:hypothetical protein